MDGKIMFFCINHPQYRRHGNAPKVYQNNYNLLHYLYRLENSKRNTKTKHGLEKSPEGNWSNIQMIHSQCLLRQLLILHLCTSMLQSHCLFCSLITCVAIFCAISPTDSVSIAIVAIDRSQLSHMHPVYAYFCIQNPFCKQIGQYFGRDQLMRSHSSLTEVSIRLISRHILRGSRRN